MQKNNHIPAFVSIMAFIFGVYDLVRGVAHTILLEYSAIHIAHLNLNTPTADDSLQLMGAFGISNYITGITLILLAIKARELALIMLGVIPTTYFLGLISINMYLKHYPQTATTWGGKSLMLVCLSLYLLTFIFGVIKTRQNKKNAKS